MPATENCYHVNLTTAGQTDADRTDGDRERTVAEERGLSLSPVQRNTVRWTPQAEQLILKMGLIAFLVARSVMRRRE
jgi:hypothetical protein